MKMRETDGWWISEDVGKRFADGLAFHQTILGLDALTTRTVYIAVALEDGRVDPTAYDSRDDAVRHQTVALDANKVAYVKVPPVRWSPKTCDRLLYFWRRKYEFHGYRPAGGDPEIIVPNLVENL